ncbi:Rv3654c family TadE-like protein [Streptomyces anulatus]
MATVWVAVTAAGLCTVFAVVLALGQAVAARHRAGGAADLAALAAADRALEGAVVACETARRVALAQGAVLVRCAVHGEIADVTARSGFGPYLPTVRARAGPPTLPRAGPPTDTRAGPPTDTRAGPPTDTRAGPPTDTRAGLPTVPRAGLRAIHGPDHWAPRPLVRPIPRPPPTPHLPLHSGRRGCRGWWGAEGMIAAG